MRIGIDARFYGSLGKGLGRYTEKLIENLEHVDTENEYLVFLREENFSEYHPKNPQFKKVLTHYAWYGIAEQTLFLLALYRLKLDLVHFPHFNVPFLYFRKYVVTIHDLILLHYPTIRNTTRSVWLYTLKFFVYRFIIASAIRRAEHIITVSQFTKRDILKHYSCQENKITVTYEAADPFCQRISPNEEYDLFAKLGLIKDVKNTQNKEELHDIIKPYLLYVGNAYPHKNLEILLKAAKILPQYTFVMVGKDDYFYSRLRKISTDENIKNVIFAGYVDDKELSALYKFAFLYLFPSLYEGFGLPPLEAMSRGLPVLSSNRGSLPEVLEEAALFFEPTSVESLKEKVLALERDTESYRALRERGYMQVKKYSFRLMAEETYGVYSKILIQKPKHAAVQSE